MAKMARMFRMEEVFGNLKALEIRAGFSRFSRLSRIYKMFKIVRIRAVHA